jgi:hypothetical protein
MARKNIKMKDFIVACIKAKIAGESASDVATKLGMKTLNVVGRIKRYKAKGIDMPELIGIETSAEKIVSINKMIQDSVESGLLGSDENIRKSWNYHFRV